MIYRGPYITYLSTPCQCYNLTHVPTINCIMQCMLPRIWIPHLTEDVENATTMLREHYRWLSETRMETLLKDRVPPCHRLPCPPPPIQRHFYEVA